ncbi:FGGY family carbohydrate kinase [Shigella flexneri]
MVQERETGKPIYNAIVGSAAVRQICEQLKCEGMEEYVRSATGLWLTRISPAPKLKWILDHVEGLRERARRWCGARRHRSEAAHPGR